MLLSWNAKSLATSNHVHHAWQVFCANTHYRDQLSFIVSFACQKERLILKEGRKPLARASSSRSFRAIQLQKALLELCQAARSGRRSGTPFGPGHRRHPCHTGDAYFYARSVTLNRGITRTMHKMRKTHLQTRLLRSEVAVRWVKCFRPLPPMFFFLGDYWLYNDNVTHPLK